MADQAEGSARSGRGISMFWVLASALGLAALALAGIGWWQRLSPEMPAEWADWFVRTVKVLLLSDIYFDPEQIKLPSQGAPNPFLEFARVPGVLFSILIAIRIVLFAFVERATEMRLRTRKGHVVLIGGGPAAAGLAEAMTGHKITHLSGELKPRGDYAQIRRIGTLEQQLQAAGARGARQIIVDEGDDSNTWNTAQAVAKIHHETDVLAHIGDPWALEMLTRADHVRLRPFSYAGSVSRQVMLAHPPYLLARRLAAKAQHILIVGFGTVGQALMREFLITSVSPQPAGMMASVVDPGIDKARQLFDARYPELPKALDIEFFGGDLREQDAALIEQLKRRCAMSEICAVYIAIDDASLPLSVAVAVKELAERLGLFRAPIFLCAQGGAGLLPVRQGVGRVGQAWDKDLRKLEAIELDAKTNSYLCDLRLVSFGSWAHSVDGAGLLLKSPDAAAEAFHQAYFDMVRQWLKPGETPKAAAREWGALAEQFRASNRRAAAHIRAKADAAGFDLEGWLHTPDVDCPHGAHELPAPEAGSAFKMGDPAFMLQLCALEHRRWTVEKRLEGWVHDAVRDDRAKKHNNIVAFETLPEADKLKDASIVEVTSKLLSAGGRKKK